MATSETRSAIICWWGGTSTLSVRSKRAAERRCSSSSVEGSATPSAVTSRHRCAGPSAWSGLGLACWRVGWGGAQVRLTARSPNPNPNPHPNPNPNPNPPRSTE